MKRICPMLVAGVMVAGCATSGPPPPADIMAAPPLGAATHRFDMDDWEAPFCAGAPDWTFDVPARQWIAFPIGWIARDEATARANWQHITLTLSVDGKPLDLPGGLVWQTDPIRFECEGRSIEGIMMGPVVYLPPVAGQRQYELRMVFNEAIHDGWTEFPKDTDFTGHITLRAES